MCGNYNCQLHQKGVTKLLFICSSRGSKRKPKSCQAKVNKTHWLWATLLTVSKKVSKKGQLCKNQKKTTKQNKKKIPTVSKHNTKLLRSSTSFKCEWELRACFLWQFFVKSIGSHSPYSSYANSSSLLPNNQWGKDGEHWWKKTHLKIWGSGSAPGHSSPEKAAAKNKYGNSHTWSPTIHLKSGLKLLHPFNPLIFLEKSKTDMK